MTFRRRFESMLAMLLLTAACLTTVAAQNSPSDSTSSYPAGASGQADTDPPGRVARIDYMSGEVSIQPGGINDWIAAELNRPLTTSDRVWTDKDSKAELNVGGGYLRLNSESSLALTNISNSTIQVQLYQGTLEMTVSYLGAGQIYEVDTPNLAFTVMKAGVYRFNVFPNDDQTWVTVRKGYGEATGNGNAVKVKAGEQVRFSNGTSLASTSEPAPTPDGFDDWAQVRDKRLDSSVSARYVAPGVIGYEDLDGYGYWQTVAPYGSVWVPYSVPAGWAPYRFGHWVWIAPWGWTWVDDAPWGFAPFHYGRWVYYGGSWGWAPGPYRYWAPCYAPALVAWVGGPGFGTGFGFGGSGWGVGVNFGWFPLGWGEPYYPWYHGWYGHRLSSTYIRNVNVTNTHITNITNITNNYYNNNITNIHYVNRTVNGAVTAAPANAIANGQQINRVGKPVPNSALMHAPVVRSINATPTREAFLGGREPRMSAIPESSAFNRSVVTHAPPPAYARPTPARVSAPAPAATPATPTAAVASGSPKPAPQPGNTTLHNVPRPPTAEPGSSEFVARPGTPTAGAETHPVPRPSTPSRNYANAGEPAAATGNSHVMHPAGEPKAVPRPPSPAEVQHVPAAAVTHTGAAPAEHMTAPPATHPSAPAHEEKPTHPSSGESKPEAAVHVPRPPANYTYHAAAPYGGGSRESGLTVMGGYTPSKSYAPAAHSYSAAPGYNTHGTYAGTTPYAPSGHSYAAVPSHSSQAGGSSAPHYSAPSGGGHSSGNSGGSSHAMHGSGNSR